TITSYADLNTNSTQDTGEPGDTATKHWDAVPPTPVLSLTPESATNAVGTEHCLDATVTADALPRPNTTVRFAITGAHPQTTAVTTNASGIAQLCYTGTTTGDDTITSYADLNTNSTQDTGEPGDQATKHWTPVPVTTVALSPQSATNPIGTQHCVTATVATDAIPRANTAVRFAVTGTNAQPATSVTTNAAGEAQYCYSGTLAGPDTITAYADLNNNSAQDAGEPDDTATKTWIAPPQAGLDHFKWYDIRDEQPRFQKRTVTIEDQFGSSQVEVIEPLRLLNPVSKNGEGINNPNAHLQCYRIKEKKKFKKIDVTIENQFGVQKLRLEAARRLCLPASKGLPNADPGAPPSGLDHFMCYRLKSKKNEVDRAVTLEDQFGR
ncbi:MAG: Ig-like domain-containing protein, partial [Nocardioidaceae bacterium]